jgi:hypothetical protein
MANKLTKDDLIHKVIQQALLDPNSGQNKTSADGLLYYMKRAGVKDISKGDIIKHAKGMKGIKVQGGNLIADVTEDLGLSFGARGGGLGSNMVANYNHFDVDQDENWEDDYEKTELDLRMGNVDETSGNRMLRQGTLSSAEYQQAKKLKNFDPKNYKWDKDKQLYVKENMKESFNVKKVNHDEWSWEFEVKSPRNSKVYNALKKVKGVEFSESTEGFFVMGNTPQERQNAIKALQSLGINEVFNGTPNKNDGNDILRWLKSQPKFLQAVKSGKFGAKDIAKGMADDVGRHVKPEWVLGALELVDMSVKESVNEASKKSVTAIANGLAKVAKEMQDLAKDYVKHKNDPAKAKIIVAQLKDLTKKKKALEKGLDGAVSSLDKEVELVANEHVLRAQIRNMVRESLITENYNFAVEDIFFLWDEVFDDERKGIESGVTTHKGKRATQISFEPKNKSKFYNDFMKKAIKQMKKDNVKYDWMEQELYIFH